MLAHRSTSRISTSVPGFVCKVVPKGALKGSTARAAWQVGGTAPLTAGIAQSAMPTDVHPPAAVVVACVWLHGRQLLQAAKSWVLGTAGPAQQALRPTVRRRVPPLERAMLAPEFTYQCA